MFVAAPGVPLQAAPEAVPLCLAPCGARSRAGIALFQTWARLTPGFDACWSSAASGISWHLNAAAGVNS